MREPKISIITVVYNGEATLEKCITSVRNQDYKNIEYIIINGNSTDTTDEIIKANEDIVDIYLNEPDNGIYDAINKGIKLANGDYIGILNSDDWYTEDHSIAMVVDHMERCKCDALHAPIDVYDSQNKILRRARCMYLGRKSFLLGFHPRHPTLVVKSAVYEKIGLFDLRYPISADYDFMFRAFYIQRLKLSRLDYKFVGMQFGGVSQNGLKNILFSNAGCAITWLYHGKPWGIMIFILKPFFKIFDYIESKPSIKDKVSN